ncbi:hypothetical protein BRC83_03585 [Halobacteriales archaeon QS_1_68_17]|nr:MAG: hypothetical protein BRC83_03585 [Halobacteriales archaeon QS_1_68_17]
MTDRAVEAALERLAYPKINPSYVPVAIDENTVHVRAGAWDGPVKTIRDPEQGERLGPLFELLDGETHVGDLLDAFDPGSRPDVAELLVRLAEDGILYDADAARPGPPHLSIKPDFAGAEPDLPAGESVVVVTVGDLGWQVAEDLLAAGLDGLTVASTATGSRAVPDSVARRDLDEIDLSSTVREASFVVACSDRPHRDLFRRVNRAGIEGDTPWLAGQVLGCNGVVGPAVFPGETACYDCFERRMLSNVPDPAACRRYLAAGRETGGTPDRSVVRTVAGYLGMDALHLLAFGSGYTAGRILTVDARTLSFAANDVLRVPRCTACSDHRRAVETQFLTLEDLAGIGTEDR